MSWQATSNINNTQSHNDINKNTKENFEYLPKLKEWSINCSENNDVK